PARRTQGHLALYSSVLDRRLFTLPEAAGPQEKDEASETTPDSEEAAGKPWEAAAAPRRRSAFQFLEQKYGYFHCKDCKTRWESAYVWCISGSNKVYFKQLCRKCQKGFNPYRVEAIQCQICSKTRCSCPQKKRHIDLKRPHRQELCGRCKGKRLSCDNTYSFKYIV
ncbi:ZAR1-like, partial [Buceros rhinoceros silvestris]